MGQRNQDYLTRHRAVRSLYLQLYARNVQHYPTEQEAEDLGIEFSGLRIGSGVPTNSRDSFFLPSPNEKYNTKETGIQVDEFCRENGGIGGLLAGPNEIPPRSSRDALVAAYQQHAHALFEKFQPPSRSILYNQRGDGGHVGSLYRGSRETGRQMANVDNATKFLGQYKQQRPHRMLVISSSNLAEEKVTLSEVEIMVSWMLGRMKRQTYTLAHGRLPSTNYHMIFPVLAVSFLEPTHGRIIQCHFDKGKLKVSFTKLFNFNAPNYNHIMDLFLKWADPIAQGDTMLAGKYLHTVRAAPQDKEEPQGSSTTTGSLPIPPPEVGLIERTGNIPWRSSPQRSNAPRSSTRDRFGQDENIPPRR